MKKRVRFKPNWGIDFSQRASPPVPSTHSDSSMSATATASGNGKLIEKSKWKFCKHL